MVTQHKALTVVGWIITVAIGAMMTASATMKLKGLPEFVEQFVNKLGYPQETLLILGIVELSCAIIFLIPRTAVLGAVLLTGYLGGAVATHVRIQDNFIAPVIVGIFVWFAVYLRDPRVRALLPIRWPM